MEAAKRFAVPVGKHTPPGGSMGSTTMEVLVKLRYPNVRDALQTFRLLDADCSGIQTAVYGVSLRSLSLRSLSSMGGV